MCIDRQVANPDPTIGFASQAECEQNAKRYMCVKPFVKNVLNEPYFTERRRKLTDANKQTTKAVKAAFVKSANEKIASEARKLVSTYAQEGK